MLDDIKRGDRIISVLNKDDVDKCLKVSAQFDEFEHYRQKMVHAYNKFQAMQVLFWDDMMCKYERCETAASRGKMLGACKMDDKFVIVERRPEKD
jgi:hypothetical protein